MAQPTSKRLLTESKAGAHAADPTTPLGAALFATYAQARPMVPVVPAAAVSVQSPYDIAGTGVHPDVVDAGAGKWNGWRYWMVYTPYWRAAARYENPVILVSNDGHNWVEPAGITNPIDPDPTGTPINSDPDMLLVGGTMYCYYRQHDATSNTEQIMLRTSTDGVTWSAETTVLDTTAQALGDRDNVISPGIVHTGTQFVMFYTNSGVLKRRTSTDGTTWTAEAACTGAIPASSHVDAIYSGGRYHLLLQTVGDTGLNEGGQGARTIVLAKSTDGVAFTVGAIPLLVSEHMGQRMIYRTCGLLETRNGKDYYRLWASCVSYGLATTAADVQAQEVSGGAESYYIGYTEGYDPNDVAANDRTSLYPAGDVIAGGQIRAKRMGALNIWGRFIVGVRGAFDILRAQEFRAGVAYVDGGNYDQTVGGTSTQPKWATRLGYAGKSIPALVIGSRADTLVGSAVLAFHNTSPGNARAVGEGWQVSVNEFGHLMFHQRAADGTLTRRGYFDYGSGDLVMDRNVTTSTNVNAANIIGSTGVTASGAWIKISTASTPASSADAAGTVGEIRRDDNYLYVKTSAGWKRAALTAW